MATRFADVEDQRPQDDPGPARNAGFALGGRAVSSPA